MKKPLESVYLKLKRAQEHLVVLDQENLEYGEQDVYDATVKADSKYVYVILKVLELPPGRFSILIGDCIHNLRSALDHLVYQLVISNSGTSSNKSCFPIYETRAGYKTRGESVIRGMDSAAAALIETLQPYHQGKAATLHPLWLIHSLSNIDKHRKLNTVNVPTMGTSIRLTTRSGVTLTPISISGGVLLDGMEIARFPRKQFPTSEDGKYVGGVDMELQGSLFMALDDDPWRTEPITVFLERSLQFVGDTVVPLFEPFF